MGQVLFKRGELANTSGSGVMTEDSIIVVNKVNGQDDTAYSEIFLGSDLIGVGHLASNTKNGLIPALPSTSASTKFLDGTGTWVDLSNNSTTGLNFLHKTGNETITGIKTVSGVDFDIVNTSSATAELVLKSASNTAATPKLRFQRGTKTDSNVDWTLGVDSSGILTATRISGSGSSNAKDILKVSGTAAVFDSQVEAASFKVTGASTGAYFIKADGSGAGGTFTGADTTGQTDGTAGLVPAPSVSDTANGYVLFANGTWAPVPTTPPGQDINVTQDPATANDVRYAVLFKKSNTITSTTGTVQFSSAGTAEAPTLSATGNGDLYSKSLTTTAAITAGTTVTSTTSMSAGTTITAGTGITATTGDIVATTGGLTATAGAVTAGTSVTAGSHFYISGNTALCEWESF